MPRKEPESEHRFARTLGALSSACDAVDDDDHQAIGWSLESLYSLFSGELVGGPRVVGRRSLSGSLVQELEQAIADANAVDADHGADCDCWICANALQAANLFAIFRDRLDSKEPVAAAVDAADAADATDEADVPTILFR